jgi:hypothetical protein
MVFVREIQTLPGGLPMNTWTGINPRDVRAWKNGTRWFVSKGVSYPIAAVVYALSKDMHSGENSLRDLVADGERFKIRMELWTFGLSYIYAYTYLELISHLEDHFRIKVIGREELKTAIDEFFCSLDWELVADLLLREWDLHKHRSPRRSLELQSGLPFEQLEAEFFEEEESEEAELVDEEDPEES